MKRIWLMVMIVCLFTSMSVLAAEPLKIVTTSGAHMRELPEKSAKVVATLRQNATLTVLEQQGDFYKVSDDTLTGWVWAKLLQKNADGTFTVSDKGAFCNSKPEKGGSSGTFRKGTKVKLIEVKPTWYKVNADGKTGWISASLVKPSM
jgi:N-acetylmuramoyl-L-alanine amidase